MRKFTKLIALLLAIVMLVSFAVACNGDTSADTTTQTDTTGPSDTTATTVDSTAPDTSDETTTAPIPPEELFDTPETFTIKKDGSTLNYTITRPRMVAADSNEMKTVQELSAYFSEKLGVKATLDTDRRREEDSEKLEIIVGMTDHPETTALYNSMTSYGEYVVRAVGNKLIILAFSDAGYARAMKHIEKVFYGGYNKDTNEITVSAADLAKTEMISKQLEALPIYENGVFFSAYDTGRVTSIAKCYEVIVSQTDSDEYGAYIKKLEAKGYTKYTETNIEDNKFAIYTNDNYTLNVGYYSQDKSARLLVEPKGALPTRAEDNKTEKVTDAQITMIAVAPADGLGLSVLIRLEDGRFIVIDGNRSEDCAHLIKTIKNQSSGYAKGKPVIAAWIITHGHHDHAGLLANKYNDIKRSGITVESILINVASDAVAKTTGNGNGYAYKVIKEAAPTFGADLYKPHVGQTFYISNCKIEILSTYEARFPELPETYNCFSTVMKMTFTDSKTGTVTTFLSTGDATGSAMKLAYNVAGDYIKSDILCVPHHGFGSPVADLLKEVFIAAAPQLILWPALTSTLEMTGKITGGVDSTHQVLFQTDSYKEVYWSGRRGGRDILVPLPYVVGNVIGVPQ